MCGLNAVENAQSIEKETLRLISHGFLHTIGFSDKKLEDKIFWYKSDNKEMDHKIGKNKQFHKLNDKYYDKDWKKNKRNSRFDVSMCRNRGSKINFDIEKI